MSTNTVEVKFPISLVANESIIESTKHGNIIAFNIAIPKTTTSWRDESWAAPIISVGDELIDFNWRIVDGADEYQGYWLMRLASADPMLPLVGVSHPIDVFYKGATIMLIAKISNNHAPAGGRRGLYITPTVIVLDDTNRPDLQECRLHGRI